MHGGVDGYTRLPVYLRAGTNNTTVSVLGLFQQANTLLVKFISIYFQVTSGSLSIASTTKVLMRSFSALSLSFGQTLSLSV